MKEEQKMWWKKLLIYVSLVVFVLSGSPALAACPSADLSGDCFVDSEDLSLMADQWLSGYDYDDFGVMAIQWLTTDVSVPNDMVYVPDGEFEMGDHHGDGYSFELPTHPVSLDAYFMNKFEITNQQYCDYLNSTYPAQIKVVGGIVYASSDTGNAYPYCDTHSYNATSQIDFSDPNFSVRYKVGRDMSDDPMVRVSWYGSVAYCNWRSSEEGYDSCYNLSTWECDFTKNGYRLPTEAEWEYAARGGEHSPYYRFPWSGVGGDFIFHDQANYYSYWEEDKGFPYFPYDINPIPGFHPDWDDGIYPYTAPGGSFSANGYGIYDMAGNVWEWCNDWYDSGYYSASPTNNPTGPASGSYRVIRGGGWNYYAYYSRVSLRYSYFPDQYLQYGFRIVLDLE